MATAARAYHHQPFGSHIDFLASGVLRETLFLGFTASVFLAEGCTGIECWLRGGADLDFLAIRQHFFGKAGQM